jgi:flavin-dependent dehydrogenase
MYDAIVIGARCAGSPTAMLLARKGYRVLLVDKAKFPSDVINGYYIQQPGVLRLKRWGLSDKLSDLNCPAIRNLSLDFGEFTLCGTPPPVDGVTEGYAPRRFVLDKILVEAAVDAGVELREGFTVQELLADGDHVTGIRGHTQGGPLITEQARIVIGADGKHSIVARSIQAPTYNTRPALTCWYYTHWSGVPVDGLRFYVRGRRTLIEAPTSYGLTVVLAGWPHSEFATFRADIEGNYWRSLELVPELAERMHSRKQEERFVGTADMENFFRKPYGAGWALVGDAGYHKDPYTAQGITDSFRDAELLAQAIDAGFSGRQPLMEALAEYERRRNEAVLPKYELTCQLAAHEPLPPEQRQLFMALQGNQADTDRFFGVFADTVPAQEFFAPESVQRIMGGRTV